MTQHRRTQRKKRVRRGLHLAGLVLLTVLSLAAPAAAQQLDSREILLATLPALRPLLPEGRSALDAEPLCTARLIGWSCPQEVKEAADASDLALQSREFTYICMRGRESCRLLGVVSLVSFSPPEVSGQTARVEAEVLSTAGARGSPPVRSVHRFDLARRRGKWQVVRRESQE